MFILMQRFVPMPGTRLKLMFVIGALALLAVASAAHAGPIGFQLISGGGNLPPADQFVLDVSLSDGAATFSIRNVGPGASSITGIYWEDRTGTLSNPSIDGMPEGVNFVMLGAPPILPGGGAITPPFETDYWMTSAGGNASNGINPGEQLDITFSTNLPGNEELENLIRSGDIRIGINLQSPGGSFVTNFLNPDPANEAEPAETPEPSTILLLGAGLGLASLLAFRRNRK